MVDHESRRIITQAALQENIDGIMRWQTIATPVTQEQFKQYQAEVAKLNQ